MHGTGQRFPQEMEKSDKEAVSNITSHYTIPKHCRRTFRQFSIKILRQVLLSSTVKNPLFMRGAQGTSFKVGFIGKMKYAEVEV